MILPTAMSTEVGDELDDLAARGLLRGLRALPAVGGRFRWDGREYLNFSSNDYLNLSNDPRIKEAAREGLEHWGCGATASRLMAGHLELHEELEESLAEWVGQPSALVFGSGYLTNLGVLTALAGGRDDAIFSDKLNHASIVDAAQLARAAVHRYRHKDLDHLERLLEKNPARGRRVIVTDSVFSMDGDIAPLAELDHLAGTHDALLVVDEAHAIGVLGRDGGGACRLPAIDIRPAVTVGTLGKSLGCYGGFAACSHELRDLLINRARGFIYSTALPPACVAGALRGVEILGEHPELGEQLLRKSARLRSALSEQGFDLLDSACQIVPVIIGEAETACRVSSDLFELGVIATAVRPPTVPPGASRLRLSVTLAHEDNDLERAAAWIGREVRKQSVMGAPRSKSSDG